MTAPPPSTATNDRRWPWAVGGLVAVTAALLVASMLRGGPGPPVIRMADPAAAERAMTGDAAPGMSGDMAWYPRVEFVLADDARFGAGRATGWQLQPPADLHAAAAALAAHVGVDATSLRSAEWGGGWMAGPQDGSGPSLWVEASGAWHLSDPTDQPMVVCVGPEPHEGEMVPPPDEPMDDTTDATAPGTQDQRAPDADVTAPGGGSDGAAPDRDAVIGEVCEPADPPVGVPTASQARDLAAAVFAELDLFTTPRVEYVHADEWGAWVESVLPIEGMTTDLRASVGFGAEGRVTWASGTLARPVDVGAYPTIDADAAVARLQNQPWRSDTMPMPALDTAETSGDPVADGASAQEDTTTPSDPMIRPVPDDLPPRQVTLVAHEPALLAVWDIDGTSWLLPAVTFTDADGGTWQVLVVTDAYLDTDHNDMGRDGTGPDTSDPGPQPEPGRPGDREPAGSGGGSPGEPGNPDPGMGSDEAAQAVIGMGEAAAIDRLIDMGYQVRVVARDGESFAVTDDLRPDRVNLEIRDGIVAHAYGG